MKENPCRAAFATAVSAVVRYLGIAAVPIVVLLIALKIIVAIGNLDCDNRIVLSNENNEDKVYAILKYTDGNQITTNNTIIGEFTNDSHSYKNINTEIYYDSMVKAGTYTGYVDFYIEVTDK